jgi:hypothetical protein
LRVSPSLRATLSKSRTKSFGVNIREASRI